MNIFEYLEYRELIRVQVESVKRVRRSLTFERLAQEMRIQKSYLSQVLKGRAELNSDQLYLYMKYFEYTAEERKFLTLLLEYSRCSLAERKKELHHEILAIQREHTKSEIHLEVNPVHPSEQHVNEYYFDPYNQLVHIALSKEAIRKEPMRLLALLGISQAKLEKVMEDLVRLGLIEVSGDQIVFKKNNLHLSKEAKVFGSWRNQMRLLAVDKLNRDHDPDNYSFSAVFSTSEEVRQSIQQDFFNFLKKAQQKTKDTEPDMVLQMNFDFFKMAVAAKKGVIVFTPRF